MTDEPCPPEDTTADHEDDAEPTLGGEVHPDPLGPEDLLPIKRYGPEDLLPSTDTETGGEGRRGGINGFCPIMRVDET